LFSYSSLNVNDNLDFLKEFFNNATNNDIDSIYIFGDLGNLENRKIDKNQKESNIIIKKEFWDKLKTKKYPIFEILNSNEKSNLQKIIEKRKYEVLNN